MNENLSKTVKYLKRYRKELVYSLVPVVLVCIVAILIGILSPKPNDNISPSNGGYLFENVNPQFQVGFGDISDVNTQYVRFESKSDTSNPFEQKEVTVWDRVKSVFSQKRGFEMRLTEVRFGETNSDFAKDIGQEIVSVIEGMAIEDVKTDTEVIEVGRLLGEFDDNPQSKKTVINKDVYPGIDVEYQILEGMGVKEEIIIRNMDEYTSGCGVDSECLLPLNEFVFDLTLDEGVVMNEAWNAVETTYYLTDADGNYLAHFLPSFAVDYTEARTNDVDMVINHLEGENYEVVVTLDPDWLFSQDRVFPVRIDPSIVHDATVEFDSGYTYNTKVVIGPKVELVGESSGVYRSSKVDFNDVSDLDSMRWTEYGASTHGGETPYSATNLVAKWNFNETGGTTAGNEGSCGANCDGALTGMATTEQDVAIGSGWTSNNRRWGDGALMFDGDNDYINVGSDVSIDDIATKTVSFWIKADSYISDADSPQLMNKGNVWSVAFDETNSRCVFGQNFSMSNGRWSVPLTSIPLGKWHNIVITYDNSSVGNIPLWYVNGISIPVTEESGPEGDAVSDASANLFLGRNYSGIMDTVSIYSRILTSSEILSNYNSGNIEFRYKTSTDGSAWSDWSGSEIPLTYEYYKTLTIGSDQVDDTLTNVSVRVSVVNNDFKSIANGGHIAQLDGGDIYFTNNVGTMQYDHEIEEYVPSTGQVVAWVEIPSVSSSIDTMFRMYYGDNYSINKWDVNSGSVLVPEIAIDISFSDENTVSSSSDMSQLDGSSIQMKQEDIVGENLILYYNLNETNGDLAGDDIFDSSGNEHNGEINGTNLATGIVDGVVGYARDFNGTDDYIMSSIGSEYNLGTDDLSIFMWVKTDTVATTQTFLSSADNRAYFGIYDSKWDMGIATSDWNTGGANITATTDWTHVGIVFDSGSSMARLYIDGVYSFSKSYSEYSLPAGWTVGSLGDHSSYFFDGKIDDLRIYANGISESDIYAMYSMGKYDRSTNSIGSVDISNESMLPFWVASDELGTNMELIYGESRYANYEIDSDTEGFWHMDEEHNNTCSGGTNDVCDSSDNGCDGAIPSDASTVDGVYGKARSFGESDDVVNLGDQNLVDNNANFTISSWIYTNSTDLAYHSVFQEELVASVGQYGTQVAVRLSGNGSTWTHTSNVLGNLEVGMWHYVVCVKEGASLRVYIDGVLAGAMSAPETLWSTTGDNLIGGAANDQIWDGMLDEVRIDAVVRSADDIRQAYEIGSRTYPITVNFKADLQSGNLITGSGDTSFSIDERSHNSTSYIEHIDVGETIVVKENYGGTTYIAQGEIASVNTSTGASTVGSWDSSSTFPVGGFTVEATVFKWQREYVDIRYLLDEDSNAVTDFTLRRTTSVGASLWLDDIRRASYFGDSSGATFTQVEDIQYVQYESIFTKWDSNPNLNLYLTQVDIDYTRDGPTTEQIMRHGKWFNDGEIQDLWWAGDE